MIHAFRSFDAEVAYGFLIIVLMAGHQDVVLEGAGFLCCVLCGSLVDNAALGQLGVSPAKVIAFGNNQDLVPGVSQGKSRGTAGQPRTDDQNGYVIACFCHDKNTSSVCAFPAVSQPSGMKGRNRGRQFPPLYSRYRETHGFFFSCPG